MFGLEKDEENQKAKLCKALESSKLEKKQSKQTFLNFPLKLFTCCTSNSQRSISERGGGVNEWEESYNEIWAKTILL